MKTEENKKQMEKDFSTYEETTIVLSKNEMQHITIN